MERPKAAVSAGQFSRLSAGGGGDGEEEDESNGEADDDEVWSEVDEDDADEELNPAIDPNPAIFPCPAEDDPLPVPGTFFLKFILP